MAGFELIRRFFGNEPGERRAAPRSGVPKGAWVLVVDDSATIRAVLGKMLSQDGHVVLKAPDGETAIEMARKEKPDLIFLDIELSDGQSFEIFNRIEVSSAIIFTTSYDEYALQAFKHNSIDYLLKPVHRDDLQRALQKYVEDELSEALIQGDLSEESLVEIFCEKEKLAFRVVQLEETLLEGIGERTI